MDVSNSSLVKEIKKADLRYLTDDEPGITRKRHWENFVYIDREGKVIKEPKTLERIKSLVIPPAWSKVWISPSENGYLQATGFDEKGRKQYIYHPQWVSICQENKFNKLTQFGDVLPEIRKKVSKDMGMDELTRAKILATVVWLLEHTLIRIGNDEYVEENNSFGLTTLRNRHVKVRGQNVKFEFRGKSGIEHSVSISHPRIAKIIKECIELPGYEIFHYLDESGEKRVVDSSDVNEYLKSITGEDFTAKDFRTWGGTVLSAVTLHQLGRFETEEESKSKISQAVKKVSVHLRNTPRVCQNYYIHPTVIDTYQKQALIPHFDKILSNSLEKDPELTKKEYALLTLLQNYS